MSIRLRFTEDDWRRVRADWSAWWAGELDRPMVVFSALRPKTGRALPQAPCFVAQLGLEMPVEEVIDRYQAHLEATTFYGDAWPRWWLNFGPGILAGFLGSKVCVAPDTVWFEPPRQVSLAELQFEYDTENVWWRRVRDLTEAAVRRWGSAVNIAHTDIGGNLDVLASFRTTEQLAMDLYDEPEQVDRLARRITELWLRYYDEIDAIVSRSGRGTSAWAPLWSPARTYMLQSDFSYMISPEMFRRWVLPDLEQCCRRLDHGFYHLDGKGQIPHLDMLLAMENLRGIQWVPGAGQPPACQWLELLKRIRDAGKLCQVWATPDGARKIVRELGGKGLALAISGWEPASDEEAADFLKVLAAEDISQR